MTGGIFETLFQVTPHFYLGPKYTGSQMHISFDPNNSSVVLPTNEVNSTFSGLGLHAQWDTRDSQFYPRKGQLADVEIAFHDPALGDSFAYQVFKLSYNQYISLAPNQVLALRAMAQFQNGDVPFYALSQFGRGPDLRGYRVGQFQDKQMFATQAEYRLMITKRFGVVAFAGVGEVVPSLNETSFDNLLPSAGAGLRYVLAEQNHVAIRLDGAWGREGGQFYLTVGEAF
jgi:outer membrane protein assembly factor BamA